MKENNPGPCGFSLIELLVVVAIIGILSVVAIPAYFNHINRTRQANGVQQLIDMKTAQEKYYALYDAYASTITDAQYTQLLSFDPTDTRYYTYSNASTNTSTFTAEIHGKNGTYLQGDCWRLTEAWADPSTCGTPVGLSFSLLTGLF